MAYKVYNSTVCIVIVNYHIHVYVCVTVIAEGDRRQDITHWIHRYNPFPSYSSPYLTPLFTIN